VVGRRINLAGCRATGLRSRTAAHPRHS
jgi:hypothetical protein